MSRLLGILIGLTLGAAAQADPATGEDCVYARDVRSVEVLSDDMLLMHGRADRLWLNRLHTRCTGLDDDMILEFARYGSKICSNDRLEARERLEGFSGIGASCRLGKFESVAIEQVQALRQSLADG